jgi:hypothetical protein
MDLLQQIKPDRMTIVFDVLWQNPEFKEEMCDVIEIFFGGNWTVEIGVPVRGTIYNLTNWQGKMESYLTNWQGKMESFSCATFYLEALEK